MIKKPTNITVKLLIKDDSERDLENTKWDEILEIENKNVNRYFDKFINTSNYNWTKKMLNIKHFWFCFFFN